MQVRDDGIYGRVEWTEAAATSIRAGEYRYLSPVIPHVKADGRIIIILNAALTNSPALEIGQVAASALMQAFDEENSMDKIAEALGLTGNGIGEDAVLAAIADLRAKGTGEPDPAKYVPIAEFQKAVAELNALRQGVTKEAATAHVEEQIKAGKLMPFMKEWGVALCSRNKPAFDEFVAGIGPAATSILTSQLPASRRPTASGEPLSAEAMAVCSRLGLTAEEFKAAGHDQAAL